MRLSSTGCPCEKKQSFMEDNFECNQHCTHSITEIHIKKWRKYKSDMELYFITRMYDGHTLWLIITKICWSGRLILYFQSALQQSQRYIISAYHYMKNLQPSSSWPRLAQNLRLETLAHQAIPSTLTPAMCFFLICPFKQCSLYLSLSLPYPDPLCYGYKKIPLANKCVRSPVSCKFFDPWAARGSLGSSVSVLTWTSSGFLATWHQWLLELLGIKVRFWWVFKPL